LADTLWRYQFRKTGAMPLPGPFPEKTHWWLGRSLLLLSVVQVKKREKKEELFFFEIFFTGVFGDCGGQRCAAVWGLCVWNLHHLVRAVGHLGADLSGPKQTQNRPIQR
jgi:hypothetical protein